MTAGAERVGAVDRRAGDASGGCQLALDEALRSVSASTVRRGAAQANT